MTTELWQRVDEIFQAAIELDADDRAAFIDTSCAGDEELRRQVESLIASDEQGLSLIDEPAFEVAAGLLVSDQPQLAEGQNIGNYEILGLIGTGGMGEVYAAKDKRLNRRIALKLLPADYTKHRDRLRRFQQEAQAASALNHPNILTIHELGEVDGQPFIATEFVDGETLRERIKRARLSLPELLDIAIQVASALAAAHRAGIIHRDIKPENVMLRPDGYVKVLDFGLAKLAEQYEPATRIPKHENLDVSSGSVMGTVRYMSPEQAQGLQVDQRSDIFSLGVMLYEMVAGRAPFEGRSNSDLVAAILKKEPPPLTQIPPGASDELQRIVNKTLHKRKEDRYPTVPDLLFDLKSLKENKAVVSRTAQAFAQTTEELSTAEVKTATSIHTHEPVFGGLKRHTFNPFVITATLAILAFAIVLGMNYLIRKRGTAARAMSISRIPNTEESVQAAISPDGKFIAHAIISADKQSLSVIELATNNVRQIAPPANVSYGGLTFSNDGSRVFYTLSDGVLYQISLLGGEAKKVLADVAGAISFAPDGKRFAFVRKRGSWDETYLMLANVDGSGERVLAKRKRPEILVTGGPAWSPDGRVIACAYGLIAGHGDMSVLGVDVETGQEKLITARKWQSVERLAWLADGSGLIAPVVETGREPTQIWTIPYPSGEARKITTDLNNYWGLSLTADSSSLVTIQFEQRSSLWIAPDGDTIRAKPVTTSKHELYRIISWTPDGRIVYASNASGARDIWVMNADGSNPTQLTADAGNNLHPYASPDGRYILFSSNRAKTGAFNIWRMDIDGRNPIQLTHGSGEVQATCSPDGRWVVYSQGGPETGPEQKTIWKVSIDGGQSVPLTSVPSNGADISPDGSLIASWYKPDSTSPWKIALIPLAGGKPAKMLEAERTDIFGLRWTPDGQAITYINTREGVSNIWAQAISGGPPKQLTQFTSEQIEAFDWSRSGELICSRAFAARDVVLISDFK